jgi:hypothetical protein
LIDISQSKSSGVTSSSGATAGDAGVGHHDVQAAQLLDGRADHRVHLVSVADVDVDHRRALPGGADLVRHPLGLWTHRGKVGHCQSRSSAARRSAMPRPMPRAA